MGKSSKTFAGFLWYSFLDIKGPLLWLITFSLAVLFRIFPLNKMISLDWIIPIGLFCLVIIITIGKAAYDSYTSNSRGLPKLILVREYPVPNESPMYLCLLEPSDLFSHGIMVSFYYDDGNFEILIGLGMIQHIREDKKIQIKIIAPVAGHEDLMERIKKNEGEVIKRVIVKPHVPQNYLSFYRDTALPGVE